MLLVFFLSSRVKLSQTEDYSSALHIWEFAGGNLQQEFVVVICSRNFPQEFSGKICHCCLKWVFCICKQILFCICAQIFFIWKQKVFICEQNFFICKIFSFCYCRGNYGPLYNGLFHKALCHVISLIVFLIWLVFAF